MPQFRIFHVKAVDSLYPIAAMSVNWSLTCISLRADQRRLGTCLPIILQSYTQPIAAAQWGRLKMRVPLRLPAKSARRCVRDHVHELGIIEGIREIALGHARSAGATHIVSVRVGISESSTYLEDAMGMFWDEVCETTAAAGARIEFFRIPGEWLCLACSKNFAGRREVCRCPDCGSQWVKPVDAPECYVESIEVETGGA